MAHFLCGQYCSRMVLHFSVRVMHRHDRGGGEGGRAYSRSASSSWSTIDRAFWGRTQLCFYQSDCWWLITLSNVARCQSKTSQVLPFFSTLTFSGQILQAVENGFNIEKTKLIQFFFFKIYIYTISTALKHDDCGDDGRRGLFSHTIL